MEYIKLEENNLHLVVGIDENRRPSLVHFSCHEFDEATFETSQRNKYYTLLEMQCSGYDLNDHHGSRYTNTSPANLLAYASHTLYDTQYGKKLEITLVHETVQAVVHYQLYQDISIVRSWTEVCNSGDVPLSLEYLTSFAYYGLSKEGEHDWSRDSYLYIPHNTWHGELQWRRNSLTELGLTRLNKSSLKRLHYLQCGTWSSSEYLPMGMYENTTAGTTLFWQIEHNGSWYWETSDVPGGGLYIQLGGPNNNESHFRKELKNGERFVSVPVAVGVVGTGFEGAVGELTRYRRITRRKNRDNEELKVIFNDYMNCLMGDPSTERELPLIDKAAEAGMEYFVIDAGWYSDLFGGDDDWWPTVGEWQESKRRFPNGLKEVTDYIVQKGMIPGLWLEIEVMGTQCPCIGEIPENWLFHRYGRPVIDHQRYQLDFRNPEVRRYATAVIDRLIRDYHVGYIKMDYNINAGIGTDVDADSVGDGLLQHNRALVGWLAEILEKYPDLVIENCGSGGQRMDYAMLSLLSIQSTSDQTDYKQYSSISAMASSAVTPEQGAVWSYPHYDGDDEQTIFNMVNTFLGRVHQSGFLNKLNDRSFSLVKEGIAYYKTIREDIRKALPIFPMGLIPLHSDQLCAGLKTDHTIYLSVWRRHSEDPIICIPLPCLKGKQVTVNCTYPSNYPVDYTFDSEKGEVVVKLQEQFTARFFEISF